MTSDPPLLVQRLKVRSWSETRPSMGDGDDDEQVYAGAVAAAQLKKNFSCVTESGRPFVTSL